MNLVDMLRPVSYTCEHCLQLEKMAKRKTGSLEEMEEFPRLKFLL